jgi:hypothetical protein
LSDEATLPTPSIRGLKDSQFGTPLTHFKGKFHSFATSVSKFTDKKGNNKVNVVLNFSDLDMSTLKSRDPYNFPTAQIEIPYSEYNKSRWGVWGNSLEKFLQKGEDVGNAVGRTITMEITEGHDLGQKDEATKAKILSSCWEVIAVEGSGTKVDPMDRLLTLIDGKTNPEFNQAALADNVIRTDQNLITGIINNTLLPAMEAKNQIKKDDKGVWHKV